MNSYSSLRKRNNGTGLAVVSLALCVVLTATVLFGQLAAYTAVDNRHYIPLTKSGGITEIAVGQLTEDGLRNAAPYVPGQTPVLSASPFLTANWFQTYDQNTVWTGETDIEIFRVSYENGAGQVTVNSNDGQKLLAPGTANTYSFALENTGYENVKYEMSMEARLSHNGQTIPVEAKVFDHQGNYLLGSPENWADVMQLNQVADAGKLKPGYVQPYTLQWQWPFEGDDFRDTELGNLAVDEDITLTIVIRTFASYTPTADDGIPKTGDYAIRWAMGTMMVSGMALLFLLVLPRRKKEEKET